MIIPQARRVRTAAPQAFAWAGLRRFQNVDLITDELMHIHHLESKWRDNVKKQAQQLRYCLIQAREYFTAAQAVSLATKPNLLYYGTMSLALAEILFKQSGESSLDKARSEHRHHGLSMTVARIPRGADLATSATNLRALPMEVDGKRKGTFELWHRTSREYPLAGNIQRFSEQAGSTISFEAIFSAMDKPYPSVPAGGITLSECFSALPLMVEHAVAASLPSHFVRGKSEAQIWPGPQWRSNTVCTFHPSPLNAALLESIRIDSNQASRVEVTEVNTGFHVRAQHDWVYGSVNMPLPPASMITPEEWRMWTNAPPLNEFGYFYVSLFLAGNYARYFPDWWLLDVERSTPLVLAIEELCTISEWRVPWLALCELGRTLLVNEP
jgi:hypothetical protein